jgi:hypothetical protein
MGTGFESGELPRKKAVNKFAKLQLYLLNKPFNKTLHGKKVSRF